jgi:hypothetical protein
VQDPSLEIGGQRHLSTLGQSSGVKGNISQEEA